MVFLFGRFCGSLGSSSSDDNTESFLVLVFFVSFFSFLEDLLTFFFSLSLLLSFFFLTLFSRKLLTDFPILDFDSCFESSTDSSCISESSNITGILSLSIPFVPSTANLVVGGEGGGCVCGPLKVTTSEFESVVLFLFISCSIALSTFTSVSIVPEPDKLYLLSCSTSVGLLSTLTKSPPSTLGVNILTIFPIEGLSSGIDLVHNKCKSTKDRYLSCVALSIFIEATC
mmetsp:Transcript_38969/g.66858  ORF Transcript_38969/g.66858 Transcript_38969/m.66858 type:complete len:228 (+) Transcript_38969:170-853(+)